MSGPVQLPRTVNPRKSQPPWLPIMAISPDDGQVYLERTGEVCSLYDFTTRLIAEPSSLVVCPNAAHALAWLNDELGSHPQWQFRVTPIIRESRRPEYERKIRVAEFTVGFFGFQRRHGKDKNRYHYPIDPMKWSRHGIAALVPGDMTQLERLLTWGQWVREWCQANGVKPSPTAGGIAAQLLRDPRFYPEVRRKIPKATNARARSALPGNYYRTYCDESRTYNAIYLDMRSAHHHCASQVIFPDANELVARGRYRVTDATVTTGNLNDCWKRSVSPGFPTALKSHGLFLLQLSVPRLATQRFPPPYAEKPGPCVAWVFSNELPMLRELGISIDGIHAALTSYRSEPGLNRYAEWALAEIATSPEEQKDWRKPMLLATYGVLAAKPRIQEFGFHHAKGAIPKTYPVGPKPLPVMAKVGRGAFEGAIVNVIHRGMIEAETRMQVLAMARWLDSHGCRILGVYADAVFVEEGNLPLLPAPWDVKTQTHNLKFFTATSFTSSELTKLPGIPADQVESFLRRLRVRRLSGVRSD